MCSGVGVCDAGCAMERLLLVMLATKCKTSPCTWWRLGGCGLEMHHPVSNNATASVRLEVYAAKELCLCVRSGCNAYSRARYSWGNVVAMNTQPLHHMRCLTCRRALHVPTKTTTTDCDRIIVYMYIVEFTHVDANMFNELKFLSHS